MKNKIEDLNNHLFAALEGLADSENPLDLNRANTIANVAKVLVESAKTEVSYLKLVKNEGKRSSLFPEDPKLLQ